MGLEWKQTVAYNEINNLPTLSMVSENVKTVVNHDLPRLLLWHIITVVVVVITVVVIIVIVIIVTANFSQSISCHNDDDDNNSAAWFLCGSRENAGEYKYFTKN